MKPIHLNFGRACGGGPRPSTPGSETPQWSEP